MGNGIVDLKKCNISDLKAAYTALYDADADNLWMAINTELCRRMGRDEYAEFTGIQKWIVDMRTA